MKFVNKQDYAACFGLDFLEHRFESVLEFPPVFGSRNQRAQVQSGKFFVLERFRNIAVSNPLGKPLDNSSLAHTRLANEDRIVLCPARKNLDYPPDFIIPSDDRIQFPLCRKLRQILCVLL